MGGIGNSPHVYTAGCTFSTLRGIAGKKITVMGLGLNGGGEACVAFFLRHGATVTVTDMKTKEQLAPTIARLARDKTLDTSRLTYVLGRHRLSDFADADCVIKNPGVKYEGNEYLAAAKAVETDLSIFLHFSRAPIIAVTGSKGKSSTVSAIHYGLTNAGFTSFLGGNITVSPLTFLEKTDGTTPVVLELSSWQLRDLRGRKALKPKISVITKTVPDHQNFYGAMEPYIADKRLIYADQDADSWTVLDASPDGYADECEKKKAGCTCWGDDFAAEANATVLRYSASPLPAGTDGAFLSGGAGYVRLGGTERCVMETLSVPGAHNRTNVLNAALVLTLMGVDPTDTKRILSGWGGIPHRLEHFLDWTAPAGSRARFYNDSAATVPEAAVAAAKSFPGAERIILICGGTDKQLDFAPLADFLSAEEKNPGRRTEALFLAGSGTDKLLSLLSEAGTSFQKPYGTLGQILEALHAELDSAGAGETVVVFSPGATSFGMFANEFDRGDTFKSAVRERFKQ